VQIPSTALIELTKQIILNPGTIVKIDLERQLISSEETGLSAPFSINAFRKQCLLSGLDNIDFLLEMKEEIIAFEQSRSL